MMDPKSNVGVFKKKNEKEVWERDLEEAEKGPHEGGGRDWGDAALPGEQEMARSRGVPLLASRQLENRFLLFSATQLVVLCHNILGKLTHRATINLYTPKPSHVTTPVPHLSAPGLPGL